MGELGGGFSFGWMDVGAKKKIENWVNFFWNGSNGYIPFPFWGNFFFFPVLAILYSQDNNHPSFV